MKDFGRSRSSRPTTPERSGVSRAGRATARVAYCRFTCVGSARKWRADVPCVLRRVAGDLEAQGFRSRLTPPSTLGACWLRRLLRPGIQPEISTDTLVPSVVL